MKLQTNIAKNFIVRAFALFATVFMISAQSAFAIYTQWKTVQTNSNNYSYKTAAYANGKFFLLGSTGSGSTYQPPVMWADIKNPNGTMKAHAPEGPWSVPNTNTGFPNGNYSHFANNCNANTGSANCTNMLGCTNCHQEFTAIAYSPAAGGVYLMISDWQGYAYSKDLVNWTVKYMTGHNGQNPTGSLNLTGQPGADVLAAMNSVKASYIFPNNRYKILVNSSGQFIVFLQETDIYSPPLTTNKFLVGTVNAGPSITWTVQDMKTSGGTMLTAKNWVDMDIGGFGGFTTMYWLASDGTLAYRSNNSSATVDDWVQVTNTGLSAPNILFTDKYIGFFSLDGMLGGMQNPPTLGALTDKGNYYSAQNFNVNGFPAWNSASSSLGLGNMSPTPTAFNLRYDWPYRWILGSYYSDGTKSGIAITESFGGGGGNPWTRINAVNGSGTNLILHDANVADTWIFGPGNNGELHYTNANRFSWRTNGSICVPGEGLGANSIEQANNHCSPCKTGFYSDDDSVNCKACPAGYVHGGTGLIDKNQCKIECPAGEYHPPASAGNPGPGCTCCPNGKYCTGMYGYAWTDASSGGVKTTAWPEPPRLPDSVPTACPADSTGGIVKTSGAPNCPSLITDCYSMQPYNAINCRGTKDCKYVTSPAGYTNCFSYLLTECQPGFYYPTSIIMPNPSPTPIDGICVGSEYYRSVFDLVGTRTSCPAGTRSGGCGLSAGTVGHCRPFIKLKNSAKNTANDYIVMRKDVDQAPAYVTSPKMCTTPNDGFKYCANMWKVADLAANAANYTNFLENLITGVKSIFQGNQYYLTNATKIVKDGFHVKLDGVLSGEVFEFQVYATGTFTVDWGDGKTETATTAANTQKIFSHQYASNGNYIMTITGRATAYSTTASFPAISFQCYIGNAPQSYSGGVLGQGPGYATGNAVRASRITGISGDLGKIFPATSGTSTIITQVPRFWRTFHGCTNLTGPIPDNIFASVRDQFSQYQVVSNMFGYTFAGTGFTGEIPGNLFAGISGLPQPFSFIGTFANANSLTNIGDGLFDGLSSGSLGVNNSYAFARTFWNGMSSVSGILTGPSAKSGGQFLYQKYASGLSARAVCECYGNSNSSGQTGLSDWSTITTSHASWMTTCTW